MRCLLFIVYYLSPCYTGAQIIDKGMMIYEVTASLKNIIPNSNSLIKTLLPQKTSSNYKTIFIAKKSASFLSMPDSSVTNLKHADQFSYYNGNHNRSFYLEQKFGKWIKSINTEKLVKIKETGKNMIIAGFNCEEIIYKDAAGEKNYAWEASVLPVEAGCIVIKNSKGAILKNAAGPISVEAKQFYNVNTIIDAGYFDWIDKLPLTRSGKRRCHCRWRSRYFERRK